MQKSERGTSGQASGQSGLDRAGTSTTGMARRTGRTWAWLGILLLAVVVGLALPVSSGGGLGSRAARTAALLLLWLGAWLFRPSSPLYRIPADPAQRQQSWQVIVPRLVTGLVVLGFLARFAANLGSLVSFQPAIFDDPVHHYLYDFDQYNDLGRALLHGHPWLSLPVPPELAAATDPYSPAEVHRLLAEGARPIYWDHAFFQGRWYSYFGVLPALLFFLPFQAVAQALGASDAILSTNSVTLLVGTVAALGVMLLVSRLIRTYFPTASLGLVGLCTAGALCAVNLPYCLFRANFYCLPILTALSLVSFGLWVWLRAAGKQVGGKRPGHDETDQVPTTSQANRSPTSRPTLWRVGLGSFLIALSLGCRPTFVLALLLALPIFWPNIRSGSFLAWLQPRRWRQGQAATSLPADSAALLPALVAFAPFLAYNQWRFGSILDFGSAYQITVSNMTDFHVPWAQMPLVVWDYLGQPLRLLGQFPFLGVTASSVPGLPDLEPQIGGYFAIYPFALYALIGLAAFLQRSRAGEVWQSRSRGTGDSPNMATALYWVSLVLGGLMVGLVSYSAGLNWRYMSDFAPFLTLAAVLGLSRLLERAEADGRQHARTALIVSAQVLVGLTLLITMASFFVQGRADAMGQSYPLYAFVRSWFV